MLRFYADKFIVIQEMMQLLVNFVEYKGEFNLGERTFDPLMQDITKLRKILISIDLKMSVISADRIKNKLKESPKADKLLQDLINELNRRITDELKTRFVFVLPSSKASFYNPKKPIFGKEVADTFNNMNEDISEAGNCFAVGRYTACVFHLMRVMEKGVQKFAAKVDIAPSVTYNDEWQTILNAIRTKIGSLYSKHSDPDRVKYESVLGHLETVKIAWRNPTMHPKATYTEEEAKALLDAVKIFMKDLVKVL